VSGEGGGRPTDGGAPRADADARNTGTTARQTDAAAQQTDAAAQLADAAARKTALTDRHRGLLVEAGAGTGKTAILAGRVALLLADGVTPRNVAAITFTELAAAEMAGRVREYVETLASGEVVPPLEPAFGASGPTDEQRRNLAAALETLDELTSTTIHGFARELALPYPVEAGVDPGASVLDAAAADLLFDDAFDAWLRRRLGAQALAATADPFIDLLTHPEAPSFDSLKSLVAIMREHPDLVAPEAGIAAVREAAERAAERFGRLVDGEPGAPDSVRDFNDALVAYVGALAWSGGATDTALTALRTEVGPLFTQKNSVRKLRAKTAWVAAARSAGGSAEDAKESYEALLTAYEDAATAIAHLLSASVDHLIGVLIGSLQGVLEAYAEAKRQRAVLDFDDLISTAARLLREHEHVRGELAELYRYVLVDEFQDTDPLQAEIVWRLTGVPTDGDWRRWPSRPGARFVVGDPNQSIYRFRGADPATYLALRDGLAQDPGSRTLRLTTNFRSVPGVLENANLSFEGPLSAPGQAGLAPLDQSRRPGPGAALVRLNVVRQDATRGHEETEKADSNEEQGLLMGAKREAEAAAVAAFCLSLVEGSSGLLDGPVSPGDIALLAPSFVGLEYYERELEAVGLNVASQAGKGFYRRQEVQDMVALTCALADPANTLALGAFLHGPMVGITDEELLDVAHALSRSAGDPQLTLTTDPAQVPVARVAEVLEVLAPLCARRFTATPFDLLTWAVEALQLKAVLVHRHRLQADRALANLERFVEAAKAYELRGINAFADDVWTAWSEGSAELEGRVDAEEDAVTLITLHSAKGLEWRVVIPVGSMSRPKGAEVPLYDRQNRRLVMRLLGHDCSALEECLEREAAELQGERVRLWYVSATRARDLLVIPRFDFGTVAGAWYDLVPWQEDVAWHPVTPDVHARQWADPAAPNTAQTPEEFAAQSAAVRSAIRHVERRAPSRSDEADGAAEGPVSEDPAPHTPELGPWILDALDSVEEVPALAPTLTVGTARGILLHKLMEDVINDVVEAEQNALAVRAAGLLSELSPDDLGVDPAEAAAMALRAWRLPEVAELHGRLLAEVAVSGAEHDDSTGGEVIWSGIADAVAVDSEGRPEVVLDWKSDRAPTPETLAHYREQVRAYLRLTGAREGIVVLAARDEVLRVLAG